jgi:hypothetical protein
MLLYRLFSPTMPSVSALSSRPVRVSIYRNIPLQPLALLTPDLVKAALGEQPMAPHEKKQDIRYSVAIAGQLM